PPPQRRPLAAPHHQDAARGVNFPPSWTPLGVGNVVALPEPAPILITMIKTIGRYEIVKELGRGAMGVVYLANDPRLHRQVAVKTSSLPDGVSEELAKEFHARFLREAQAAAGLSHPGLVTIYDAGEDAALGLPYIAMEYIPGQTLKQRLDKR